MGNGGGLPHQNLFLSSTEQGWISHPFSRLFGQPDTSLRKASYVFFAKGRQGPHLIWWIICYLCFKWRNNPRVVKSSGITSTEPQKLHSGRNKKPQSLLCSRVLGARLGMPNSPRGHSEAWTLVRADGKKVEQRPQTSVFIEGHEWNGLCVQEAFSVTVSAWMPKSPFEYTKKLGIDPQRWTIK
jgi:hypothetical protein